MSESISFHSQGLQLSGTLHRTAAAETPLIVGLHGLFSDSNSPKQLTLAERCNAAGIAYLRFDHRGCGQSRGDLEIDTTFDGRCSDLSAAVAWAKTHLPDSSPLGLFGSSYGGSIALAMAEMVKARAVVTVAAPIRSGALKGAIADPAAPAFLSDPNFRKRLQFDITGCLKSVHHLLLFHGDRDEIVPVAHAHEIYAAAQDPKRLCIQKSGDHRMSLSDHQASFVDETLAWFTKYLKPASSVKQR